MGELSQLHTMESRGTSWIHVTKTDCFENRPAKAREASRESDRQVIITEKEEKEQKAETAINTGK